MLKELLKENNEIGNFVSYSDVVSINYDTNFPLTSKKEKSNRLKELFLQKSLRKDKLKKKSFSSIEKTRIVVEGFLGEKSVNTICQEYGITIDIYNSWKSAFVKAFDYYSQHNDVSVKFTSIAKRLILEHSSLEVYEFFSKYADFKSGRNFVLPSNEKLSSFSSLTNISNVVVLDRMNNYGRINKYLENINEQMPNDGLLFGCFETFNNTVKNNRLAKTHLIKGMAFLFNRVLPKIKYINKLYFAITKGEKRQLSKAEALGRLVSCGFDIIDLKVINYKYYFVVKKIKAPEYNMNPSYGPLFKMNRVGKNGKIIGVYKLRTMHPYSEYLQDYVLKQNGYSKTGKLANDFRVVPWAKVLRKYWLDELPQLINVLKGDMKLVGIRPVSQSYFNSSIPSDIQDLRLTQKPGCIPPYVALNRKSSVESVLEAERDYLEEKIKAPYTTDAKYFFKAIYNILIKNKRSA